MAGSFLSETPNFVYQGGILKRFSLHSHGKQRIQLSWSVGLQSVYLPKFNKMKPKSRLNNISLNLLIVYRESVNLIGYITRTLSADSQQL